MNYKRFGLYVALFASFSLTGCSVMTKNAVAKDLSEIIEYGDCPTVCAALKEYAKTKLGVVINAIPTPPPAQGEGATGQ